MEKMVRNFDRVFLSYIVVISLFGLAALTSASGPFGYRNYGDSLYFVKRQIIFGFLPGIILATILFKINYAKWKKIATAPYIFSLFLLSLVFIPGIGAVVNGGRNWIRLFGFNFQPSEFFKLAFIIFAAYILSDKRRDLSDFQMGLLPVLILLSPGLIMILLQPDMGTLFIAVMIMFGMLFQANIPKKYLLGMGFLAVAVLSVMVYLRPYRLQRITIFMHPELDPQGIGYQVNQAFLAVGSGGMFGRGVGQSIQKYQYLPEVHSDSIFAIVAEETGFLVSAVLIIFIMLICLRCLKIGKNSENEFGCLVAVGIGTWFFTQSALNIGAMVGALPLTGVPLPFVSHGGTALMSELAAVGLILNISKKEI